MNVIQPIIYSAIAYLAVGAVVVLVHPQLIREQFTELKSLDKDLQILHRKLEKLVRVALKIKKPIAF